MPITAVDVAVAVIRYDGYVNADVTANEDDGRHASWFLLGYRHAKQDQGGCHEFVGGKIESSETATDALIREVQEEIGLDIRHNELTKLGEIEHEYPNKCVRLHVYEVRLTAEQYRDFNQSVAQAQPNEKKSPTFSGMLSGTLSGALLGRQGQPLIWVTLPELLAERYRLPDANAQILSWLKSGQSDVQQPNV